MKFTVIPQDTFQAMQLNAGVLLKTFDPKNPAAPKDEDIICATTGGITIVATPTYTDMGADVDNCPNNMMELKTLEGWDCKISFTGLGTSPENIRMALGAADINAVSGAIELADKLKIAHFSDKWWVGDRADGGMVAAHLKNALSTGGLTLKTTKNGKGQISVELTGHVSIKNQKTMPMEFYSTAPGVSSGENQ